jgi:hypothetical protein
MDLSETIAPTSDQLDAVDLVAGPRVFTIERVTKGSAEQPVNIHLAEFPRPWRPGKSMLRVLVAAWGVDATQYVGRQVLLFCDPTVTFGKDKVGGTRIRALSHIDKPIDVPLLVARGRTRMYKVEPLKTPQGAAPSMPASSDGAGTPGGRVEVEGEGVGAPDAPPPADPILELMARAGITDKNHAQRFVSDVIGRDVTSREDLTPDERTTLIEALKREAGEP